MRIATTVGYWSSGPPADAAELFAAADRLGFDQVWTAEAYGSDAWTPLAWWGSRTTHVKLGTGISQLSARPPATLAMAAMTMDHLTRGRVIIGVGTSNPQVVEGWYGQPYPRPLERTREYIEILRAVIARTEPVTYDGQHYQLPLRGGTGLGKPLRSILHPVPPEIPIYLGAEGPKNVALAAEIADGWNLIFFSPPDERLLRRRAGRGLRAARRPAHRGHLRRGGRPDGDHHRRRHRAGRRPAPARRWPCTSAAWAPAASTSTMRSSPGWATRRRPRTIQDHYLAGDKKAAIAAVPTAMVEDVALIGPWAKIADEIPRWKQTVLTTFLFHTELRHLATIADLVRGA